MTSSQILIIAALANLLIFTSAWAFCSKIKNFSPVDAFWAACIGLTSLFFLLFESLNPKQITASILIAAWSARLTYHLTKRIAKHHPEEDTRYEKLRELWQEKSNPYFNPYFLLLFLGNATLVLLLTLPFHLIATDPDPTFDTLSIIGTLVTLTGLIGEYLADKQMSDFKSENSDRKAICKKGLWKYSRHPNYFFESVIWFGFFIFALGSPWGWTTIYAPAIITFLLLKVTGIPPSEKSSLKSKGDAYRQYQRTTSPFIPLPPKASPTDR